MTTATEIGAWACWHPVEGFGRVIYVSADMEFACADRDVKRIETGDDAWKVVPVRVVRVDHTCRKTPND